MYRLKIKETAEHKGMSMAALMKKSGVDIKTLRKMYHEPGEEIKLGTLDRIAQALDVDISTLIESVRE